MDKIVCRKNLITIYDWKSILKIETIYYSILFNVIKYLRHREEWERELYIDKRFSVYKWNTLLKKWLQFNNNKW